MKQHKPEHKSKFLSLLLRHKPEQLDLDIADDGYTPIHDLLEKWNLKHVVGLSYLELKEIVADDNKGRYSITDVEGVEYIRANQGHSLKNVCIDFKKKVPPVVLYHGTKTASLQSITKYGLSPRRRTHVHLSEDVDTAKTVADRRKGESCILKLDCKRLVADGYEFYQSENNVWLSNEIPPEYFEVMID